MNKPEIKSVTYEETQREKRKGRLKRLAQWAFRIKCLPATFPDDGTLRAPSFDEAWNQVSNT